MRILALLAVLVAWLPSRAWSGGGPENLVLVVNADSWASQAIANEYIRLRQIPSVNVVYLDNLPDVEAVNVDQFRDLILLPALKAVESRGLAAQIDYLVYSSDLPYLVDVNPDVAKLKERLPQVITPSASINGLTYLYRYVLAKHPGYLRLDANRYYRRPMSQLGEPRLDEAQQKQLAEAHRQLNEKKWAPAIASLVELEKAVPRSGLVQYLLARARASLDQTNEAMASLDRAIDLGFPLPAAQIQADPTLASLRELPQFAKAVERAKARAVELQPTRGFHGSTTFGPQGDPSTAPDAERYLLSTMLAMTSGRGNSVREALAYLRSAAEADGKRPKGTIYFVKNGDVRSTTRMGVFEAAVARLKALGVQAEIVEGSTPTGKNDVQGCMMGISDFNWQASKSTILPGAICEHLTSFGGVMQEAAGQTPLSEFLRNGAAGASGTVTEPFAIQAKFPLAYLHAHYAQGCTLAESFYQSVLGPYQLLIVGDPLCRPWARIPQVKVEGVPNGPVSGKVELRPKTDNPQLAVAHFELFLDGHRRLTSRPGDSIVLDLDDLPEGFHEARIVAVTDDEIQSQGRAVFPLVVRRNGPELKVEPPEATVSWDQKLRLKLSLAGGRQMVLLHNRREVAGLVGASGEVEIDPRVLGQGECWLEPMGMVEGDTASRIRGVPIRVIVKPPVPWPALKAPASKEPGKGLRVVPDGGEPRAAEETRSGDWLAKAGVSAGKGFEASGYFDVPEDDVYQFQLRANLPVSIEVDGNLLELPKNQGWKSLPVSLAAGTHQVRVRATPPPQSPAPHLELRFGGPGMSSVGAHRFRH